MGSLVYCKDLENSPYRDLHSSLADIDLRSQFARDYCRLLGLPPDSALYTCVTAGSAALPILIKASVLMSKADWISGDVLPVSCATVTSQIWLVLTLPFTRLKLILRNSRPQALHTQIRTLSITLYSAVQYRRNNRHQTTHQFDCPAVTCYVNCQWRGSFVLLHSDISVLIVLLRALLMKYRL